jgi:aryl-alcohol dehydrogenase-like predicted oxidoreductase
MGEGLNQQGLSRKHIIDQCKASLDGLKTNYIDLYQIHRWDDETPIEETLSTLSSLVSEGLVRYIGASTMMGWQFMNALGKSDFHQYERFVSMQSEYSLVDRHGVENLLPVCADQEIGVIPWSPLGSGFLTGKYDREEEPETGRAADDDYTRKRFTEENWAVLDVVRERAEKREPHQYR